MLINISWDGAYLVKGSNSQEVWHNNIERLLKSEWKEIHDLKRKKFFYSKSFKGVNDDPKDLINRTLNLFLLHSNHQRCEIFCIEGSKTYLGSVENGEVSIMEKNISPERLEEIVYYFMVKEGMFE